MDVPPSLVFAVDALVTSREEAWRVSSYDVLQEAALGGVDAVRQLPFGPHHYMRLVVGELALDATTVALDASYDDVLGVHCTAVGGQLEPVVLVASDDVVHVGERGSR